MAQVKVRSGYFTLPYLTWHSDYLIWQVDDGGSRVGGVRLVDPRAQASMVPVPARWTYGMGEHIRVQALPGLFVLFPAWAHRLPDLT